MGFDTANPLGGLNTNLTFTPGGNPYADVTPAGLATSYGQTYNSALAANQQNYNNVIGGYKSLAGNVASILGQGGGWGVAQPAAQAIQDTLASAKGGAMQNSINKGLGSSTAAVAAQRGANLDAEKAYGSLGAQLAQTYAGYTAGIGQNMLGAMNSVNIPYPNAGEYSSLYQQYGQQQQSAMNMAMLAQQQAAQQQLALRSLSMSRSGGGGGGGAAPTPQMPRGGTYGSGGGSFASGGGLTPSGFGMPMNGAGGSSASATGGGFNPNLLGYGTPMPQSINPSQYGGDLIGGDDYGGMIGMGGGDFGGGGAF